MGGKGRIVATLGQAPSAAISRASGVIGAKDALASVAADPACRPAATSILDQPFGAYET